jgi:hypothetical protein
MQGGSLLASYASGTMGTPSKTGDRLLNIGWATKVRHGALTLPRELNYEQSTHSILANPIKELETRRNGSVAHEAGVVLGGGNKLHTVLGTDGGAATAADVELKFVLPSSGEAVVFTAVVLANAEFVIGGGDQISHGVTISLTISTATTGGSISGARIGAATIDASGAGPYTIR